LLSVGNRLVELIHLGVIWLLYSLTGVVVVVVVVVVIQLVESVDANISSPVIGFDK
jgi:hypothetical protein